MNNSKEIILKLKEVRIEKGLSLNDIVELVEKNGDYISRSSVQRVFADGSEDAVFKYEETIRPIANALLDIDRIEIEDDLDTQALKTLLQYKNQRIKELEAQLDKDKIKYHEKLDKEREQSRKSIEFLKEQVAYKDKRMDLLLDSNKQKEERFKELLAHILYCPYRNCGKE
jgi:transcriptional regulator with XRE-family HTH domain